MYIFFTYNCNNSSAESFSTGSSSSSKKKNFTGNYITWEISFELLTRGSWRNFDSSLSSSSFFCGVKYEISVRGGQVAIEISSHRCWMNGICGCLLIVNDVEEKIKCAVFNLFLFSYKLVGLKLNETTSTTWVKSERMFWWKVEEIWTSSLVHEKVNDGRSQWHLRRVMNEPNEIDGPPQNLIYVAFLFPTIHDFSIMLKINKGRGKKFKWRKQEEKFLQ